MTGPETKSIRNGAASIVDAFAVIEEEEAYIYEMNIEPYKFAQQTDYDPKARENFYFINQKLKDLLD